MKASQAVQEVLSQVQELETRNEQLETRIQQLEARNKELETRIELEFRVRELESQNKRLSQGLLKAPQEVRQNDKMPKRGAGQIMIMGPSPELIDRLRRGTPLTKPMNLSPELADIVGKKVASRAECIKQLWVYIKNNKLQDPENKQFFVPDKKMAKVTF